MDDDVESARFAEQEPLLRWGRPAPPDGGMINDRYRKATNREEETDSGDDDENHSEDDEVAMEKRRAQRLKETGGWWGYLKDFDVFAPYLIPRGDVKVQLCIAVCMACLAAQRVLYVLIPAQLGAVANGLLAGNGHPPYRELAVWLLLSVVGGKSGIGLALDLAKVPVRQFSERAVAKAAFAHVMALSMDFHAERDAAEVMKAVEQGGALMRVLERAATEVLPTVADLAIAAAVLYARFGAPVAAAIAAAFSVFLALEAWTSTRWRIAPRRAMARAEREEARVMHGAIQGWAVTHLFGALGFENRRFGAAVDARLQAEWRWTLLDSGIEGLLEAFEPLTFAALAAMVLRRVADGRASPSDFVFFAEYWHYLFWPLKYLMYDYRQLLSDLIDAERLLALLQTKASIADRLGARELGDANGGVVQGHVKFDDVSLEYDGGERGQAAVAGLSFSAAPGETVAFVGVSGAGKSTIVKLLLRFYDPTGGRVLVDGHDVRDVTLESLRGAFGVVPQEAQLFDGTILDNVRYARPDATDADVFAACSAAAMHERILSFRNGYATRVGEGGVKLSGGEAQRLALARALLRDPPVLVLDEATSAVDSRTEEDIQRALDAFRRRRARTTLVVAHRLSTIVGADRIMVMDQGRCVESGTHAELLASKGRYAELWSKQAGVSLP